MPEPGPSHAAQTERNRLLSQTRAISFGIAGGAVLASLGLGTAFAHALPGHSKAPAVSAQPGGSQPGSGQPGGGRPAGSTGPAPSKGSSSIPARSHHRARSGHQARHHHHALAPPTQAPAPAPSTSAPPVSSGGS